MRKVAEAGEALDVDDDEVTELDNDSLFTNPEGQSNCSTS